MPGWILASFVLPASPIAIQQLGKQSETAMNWIATGDHRLIAVACCPTGGD